MDLWYAAFGTFFSRLTLTPESLEHQTMSDPSFYLHSTIVRPPTLRLLAQNHENGTALNLYDAARLLFHLDLLFRIVSKRPQDAR